MGASNVAQVYANWASLPHVPFRALAYMALVSMDSDAVPRYFGGVEALAVALGRPACEHRDRKAVSDALTFLRRAGAVESLVKGSRGHRAEYGLNLAGPAGKHHVQRDESTTVNVTKHHGERDKAPRSPWSPGVLGGRGTEGGTTSPQVPDSRAAVAELPAPRGIDLEQCPGCRFLRWEGVHAQGCAYASRPAAS